MSKDKMTKKDAEAICKHCDEAIAELTEINKLQGQVIAGLWRDGKTHFTLARELSRQPNQIFEAEKGGLRALVAMATNGAFRQWAMAEAVLNPAEDSAAGDNNEPGPEA